MKTETFSGAHLWSTLWMWQTLDCPYAWVSRWGGPGTSPQLGTLRSIQAHILHPRKSNFSQYFCQSWESGFMCRKIQNVPVSLSNKKKKFHDFKSWMFFPEHWKPLLEPGCLLGSAIMKKQESIFLRQLMLTTVPTVPFSRTVNFSITGHHKANSEKNSGTGFD